MTWISYLFFGAVVSGFVAYGRSAPVLAPWDSVNSDAYALIVNTSPDTLEIFAQAPAVDSTSRFLGRVAPHDSTLRRIPYADTEVSINGKSVSVNRPGVYRVELP